MGDAAAAEFASGGGDVGAVVSARLLEGTQPARHLIFVKSGQMSSAKAASRRWRYPDMTLEALILRSLCRDGIPQSRFTVASLRRAVAWLRGAVAWPRRSCLVGELARCVCEVLQPPCAIPASPL